MITGRKRFIHHVGPKIILDEFDTKPLESIGIHSGMSCSSHPFVCKVLVVEDDPLLRLDAIDLVEEAGFEAVEASNADQALRLLERDPDIGILFTDVDMPGSMDGVKLAHLVHHRWPPVAILVTSGHLRLSSRTLPEKGQFFAKPYLPVAVQAALSHAARTRQAA